ncbi:MAG: EutN/CcmL family microcompartment protein [Anaerolineales bacterium]
MYIGKVIGTVVATIKIDHLEARKLLIVDMLDLEGKETGYYDIAVDVVQAGPGDTVMVIDEGNGARQILGLDPGAIRAVIVGVVDEVALQEVSDVSSTTYSVSI